MIYRPYNDDPRRSLLLIDLESFTVLHELSSQKNLTEIENVFHYEKGELYCTKCPGQRERATKKSVAIIDLRTCSTVAEVCNSKRVRTVFNQNFYCISDSNINTQQETFIKVNPRTGQSSEIALDFGRHLPEDFEVSTCRSGHHLVLFLDKILCIVDMTDAATHSMAVFNLKTEKVISHHLLNHKKDMFMVSFGRFMFSLKGLLFFNVAYHCPEVEPGKPSHSWFSVAACKRGRLLVTDFTIEDEEGCEDIHLMLLRRELGCLTRWSYSEMPFKFKEIRASSKPVNAKYLKK